MQLKVEIEETVFQTADAKNGAGALWCYGAPLVARIGERVFVSAMEVGEGLLPLCNTRPRILMRNDFEAGWHTIWHPDDFREREPCPIVGFHDGAVFLSVNPLVNINETRRGLCNPHLLQFSTSDLKAIPKTIQPNWVEGTTFTEHSYRGLASDGVNGEILTLNIDAKTGEQCWSFCHRDGSWVKRGKIGFPIRACYPQVALKNRAAHVLAIGDIVEPIEEWRRHKFEQTKRDWDYVFRRLFYTWTPDIATTDFASSLEVETVDASGGHINNLDLWCDADGNAHLLYIKQPVVPILRQGFFPHLRLTRSLEHCIIRQGEIVSRNMLLLSGEDLSGEAPIYARFQATPDGKLLVVYASNPSAMKVIQILPQRTEPIKLELRDPLRTFFTAAERGGSKPSDIIDLFGIASDPHTLRYVCLRIGE